jgi:hypothetical protein
MHQRPGGRQLDMRAIGRTAADADPVVAEHDKGVGVHGQV